jgi:hypothetical protein
MVDDEKYLIAHKYTKTIFRQLAQPHNQIFVQLSLLLFLLLHILCCFWFWMHDVVFNLNSQVIKEEQDMDLYFGVPKMIHISILLLT